MGRLGQLSRTKGYVVVNLRLRGFIDDQDLIHQSQIGSEATGAVWIPGFCMTFSLQWAVNCQEAGASSRSPVEEFRDMMSRGGAGFKQSIQSQRAYEDYCSGSAAISVQARQHEITGNIASMVSKKAPCVGGMQDRPTI